MKLYKLFLDESENTEKNILVVAGVAIECDKEKELEAKILLFSTLNDASFFTLNGAVSA